MYSPKTLSEFYKFTIDAIYAFIIGLSFVQLDNLVTPFEKIFQNFIPILGVGFVYFLIIAGWVGYHKSIMIQPHWGRFGTLRYLIDLFIMFIVYNLLLVSNPSSSTMYGQIFIYLIPILFTLYLIWDMVRIFEFRKRYPLYTGSLNGFKKTIIFGFVALVISAIYAYILPEYIWTRADFTNRNSIDIYFVIIFIIHTCVYRWIKSIKVKAG